MRAVVQRVSQARVEMQGNKVSEIAHGLLVYLGVAKADTERDAEFMADKLVNLRIFEDEAGKMNRSLLDVGGQMLLVSNFTVQGDCRKGRRPGFDAAAAPPMAERLYETAADLVVERGVTVHTGVFGQYTHISSVNDGPVNFLLDSTRLF